MFEQGLSSLFYQIKKNAFGSLPGTFKAARLMFIVRACLSDVLCSCLCVVGCWSD
jgi:hypothetical protein